MFEMTPVEAVMLLMPYYVLAFGGLILTFILSTKMLKKTVIGTISVICIILTALVFLNIKDATVLEEGTMEVAYCIATAILCGFSPSFIMLVMSTLKLKKT